MTGAPHSPTPHLDVVICTYNNAALLDRALQHLASQRVAPQWRWQVTVIDNNCTDDTSVRVDEHIRAGLVPGLRRLVETEQGLTAARLRGLSETSADWIAFVDDDCLLDPNWIDEAVRFTLEGPPCGGFGGHVEVAWDAEPPPGLETYGTLFAEQYLGERPRESFSLVGAGMVLHRQALAESGWPERPLLGDRIGKRLTACGDLEIALRIRNAGYPLWYQPACHLQHVMPAHRTELPHLLPLASGLGAGLVLTAAMTSTGRFGWVRHTLLLGVKQTARAARRTLGAQLGRRTRLCARIDRRFAAGTWHGTWQLFRMPSARRDAIVGLTPRVPPVRWGL